MNINKKKLSTILKNEIGPITFGRYLKSMRDLHNLTQHQLAKTLNLSVSSICDIEKGRHLVSPSLASKIAKTCNFPESIAIEYALQDQVTKAKLKYRVKLSAA